MSITYTKQAPAKVGQIQIIEHDGHLILRGYPWDIDIHRGRLTIGEWQHSAGVWENFTREQLGEKSPELIKFWARHGATLLNLTNDNR